MFFRDAKLGNKEEREWQIMVYIVLLTLFSVLFSIFTGILARIFTSKDQKGMSKTKTYMYIFMNCQRP